MKRVLRLYGPSRLEGDQIITNTIASYSRQARLLETRLLSANAPKEEKEESWNIDESQTNLRSILAYDNEKKMLLTGDSSAPLISELIKRLGTSEWVLFKVPHHGKGQRNFLLRSAVQSSTISRQMFAFESVHGGES